jgi:hypothetical protein
MSVVRQDPELVVFCNELEAKVLILIEENKKLKRRVKVLEKAAEKHGVFVGKPEEETDTCIIV